MIKGIPFTNEKDCGLFGFISNRWSFLHMKTGILFYVQIAYTFRIEGKPFKKLYVDVMVSLRNAHLFYKKKMVISFLSDPHHKFYEKSV